MFYRAAALALAAGIAVASGFAVLIGTLWGFSLKCDDACSTPPPWRDDPNAWQWDALGMVAIAAFSCAVLFLGAVTLQRRFLAFGVLVLWAVLAGAFLNLFRDAGLTSHAERGWAGLAVLFLAGVSAVASTAHRRDRRQPSRMTGPPL